MDATSGRSSGRTEIVDDWMFFYTRQRISTTDVATWTWLFDAVDALMAKLDQWARWRDDHVDPDSAATVEA